MKPLILMLLLSSRVLLNAQTSDQFTDGDFLLNPLWMGDDSLFKVNTSFQLQSKGTGAKDIYLSTSSTTTSGEWHFWCRFNLSPSTSNFMRVYLLSDSANLKGSLDGYYVQLGGVTGSTDSITLYKQKGNVRTRIIGGRPGTVSKTNNLVRIKVLRDLAGNWQLFSDTTGGYAYTSEGTGLDQELFASVYTGVFVRFTSSNAQNYYLDDVYAGPVIVDSTPPRLDSVQVLSDTLLRLAFSENITAGSALNVSHYDIDNGVGYPLSAQFESGRSDVVLLRLNSPLTNNVYQLTANSIADMAGNSVALLGASFIYDVYNPKPFDIIITEFFPDPTPVVGLPEAEFVELYNHTAVPLSLKGWTLSDGTTTAVLPDTIVVAGEFVIVCAATNAPAFSVFGKTISVASLPSLNNGGDQLILKDKKGNIIHHLQYDLSWYHHTQKVDGGYSIEMNNPEQLCKGKYNFGASDDAKGGTPGRQNSRWSLLPDTIAPVVNGISLLSDKELLVVFNESMDSLFLLSGTIVFRPTSTINNRQTNGMDTLVITVNAPFINKQQTHIELNGFNDCSGNEITNGSDSFTYIVADTAHVYDILINEIMADPEPVVGLPDAEYIELYNRSERLIDLAGWTIADVTTSTNLPTYLLSPDSFVVLVSETHFSPGTLNTIGLKTFPSLGNDGDALTLKDSYGHVIHHLRYGSTAYKHAVKKNGGWSLEVVDALNPCGNNLRECEDKSGGTPGRVNSVKATNRDHVAPQLLTLYPVNPQTLELRFNESLDSTSLLNLQQYTVDKGLGQPQFLLFQPPAFERLQLVFNDSFKQHEQYKVRISSITDCAGNILQDESLLFGLPDQQGLKDIVINELLFDPRGEGSDFVELYNRSAYPVDLKNMYLANADEAGQVKDFYPIDSFGLIIQPQSYMVLTDNPSDISRNYTVTNPKHLVQCKMPAYSNTEGTCLLIDLKGNEFDRLTYSDKMHFALLDNKDGVSLERIDFSRPASDNSNWTSASATAGYATPTAQNSQFTFVDVTSDLKAEPEVFSPDGDGYNDQVHFSYRFEEPGYTGSMKIYNASGQLTKNLLRNEMLGTSGVFSWDGITDDGNKAPIGIYLCYFEAFNLNGEIIRKKITTVVGAKL